MELIFDEENVIAADKFIGFLSLVDKMSDESVEKLANTIVEMTLQNGDEDSLYEMMSFVDGKHGREEYVAKINEKKDLLYSVSSDNIGKLYPIIMKNFTVEDIMKNIFKVGKDIKNVELLKPIIEKFENIKNSDKKCVKHANELTDVLAPDISYASSDVLLRFFWKNKITLCTTSKNYKGELLLNNIESNDKTADLLYTAKTYVGDRIHMVRFEEFVGNKQLSYEAARELFDEFLCIIAVFPEIFNNLGYIEQQEVKTLIK